MYSDPLSSTYPLKNHSVDPSNRSESNSPSKPLIVNSGLTPVIADEGIPTGLSVSNNKFTPYSVGNYNSRIAPLETEDTTLDEEATLEAVNFSRYERHHHHQREYSDNGDARNAYFVSNHLLSPMFPIDTRTVKPSFIKRILAVLPDIWKRFRYFILRRRQDVQDGTLFFSHDALPSERYTQRRHCVLGIGLVWFIVITMLLFAIYSNLRDVAENFTKSMNQRYKKQLTIKAATEGLIKKKTRFLDIYLDPTNSSNILFGMPYISGSRSLPILLSAIYHRGNPQVEATAFTPAMDDIILSFYPTTDKKWVQVYKVPQKIRTSLSTYMPQISLNTWTGPICNLPIIAYESRSTSTKRQRNFFGFKQQNVPKTAHSTTSYIVMDGTSILHAFASRIEDSCVLSNSIHLLTSEIKTYERNFHFTIEFKACSKNNTNAVGATSSVKFSLTELPEKPMTPRSADSRIGYFTTSFIRVGPGPIFQDITDVNNTTKHDCGNVPCTPDTVVFTDQNENYEELTSSLSSNTNSTLLNAIQRRHLLSPFENSSMFFDDWDKRIDIIQRRRLDTPNSNIIYYIGIFNEADYGESYPNVPQRWWKPIREGVEIWDTAFQRLGRKPGTVVAVTPDMTHMWPKQYSIGNTGINTISMVADTKQAMALGPSTVDPRSGEIISSNIVITSRWMQSWLKSLEFWIGSAFNNSTNLKYYENDKPQLQANNIFEDNNPQILLHKNVSTIENRLLNMGSSMVPSLKGFNISQLLTFLKYSNESKQLFESGSTSFQNELKSTNPLLLLMLGEIHKQPAQRQLFEERDPIESKIKQILLRILKTGMKAVVMHEVGHTLGLRHNFKASTQLPWSQRTNTSYIERHSLGSSVMDYTAINIPLKLFNQSSLDWDVLMNHHYFAPCLGEYDYSAIHYGYMDIIKETLDYPSKELESIASDSQKHFSFGTDEDLVGPLGPDPLNNVFDLSDPLEYAFETLDMIRLIRNRIYSNNGVTQLPTEMIHDFELLCLTQIGRAGMIMAKYIGGFSIAKVGSGSTTKPLEMIAWEQQHRALNGILEILSSGFEAYPLCNKKLNSANNETLKGIQHKNIQGSLFSSASELPYMVSKKNNEHENFDDYMFTGMIDLSFYGREFSSFLSMTEYLKTLLIIITLSPARLYRVHHAVLYDQLQRRQHKIDDTNLEPKNVINNTSFLTRQDSENNNDYLTPLSPAIIIAKIGETIFPGFSVEDFCSPRWPLQITWIRTLGAVSHVDVFNEGANAALPIVRAAAFRELARIGYLLARAEDTWIKAEDFLTLFGHLLDVRRELQLFGAIQNTT